MDIIIRIVRILAVLAIGIVILSTGSAAGRKYRARSR